MSSDPRQWRATKIKKIPARDEPRPSARSWHWFIIAIRAATRVTVAAMKFGKTLEDMRREIGALGDALPWIDYGLSLIHI